MLYELSQDVAEMLRARKYPIRVEYGPARPGKGGHHHSMVIVIERAPGDRFAAPTGVRRNPRHAMNRALTCTATVYAKSSLPGAHRGDHERLCEQLVDALAITLREWFVEAKALGSAIVSGGYLTAADRDDVEVWPGVVYALRFDLARGALRRDFDGEALPVAAATGVRNRTEVRTTAAGSTPETGCDSLPVDP